MKYFLYNKKQIFFRKLFAYLNYIFWFIRDGLWRLRLQSLMVILFGSGGVALQVATFGLLINYAHHISSGEVLKIKLVNVTFDPRSSVGLLILESAISIILLSFSAIIIYFSKTKALQMATEYEVFCAIRVFRYIDRFKMLVSNDELCYGKNDYLIRLISADARLAGRILRMMLNMVVPTAKAIFCLLLLFHIHVIFTLAILITAPLLFWLQYQVSLRTATLSKHSEKINYDAHLNYRGVLAAVSQDFPCAKNEDNFKFIFKNEKLASNLNLYEMRLKFIEKSKMISDLFMGFIFGLIIITMGGEIIFENSHWGMLLAYMLALRMISTNMQHIFTELTCINRFYHKIQRYLSFLSFYSQVVKGGEFVELGSSFTVKLANFGELSQLESLIIKASSKTALVFSQKISRYSLFDISLLIFSEKKGSENKFLSSSNFISASQVNTTLALGPIICNYKLESEKIFSILPDPLKSSYVELMHRVKNNNNVLTKNEWKSASIELRCVLIFYFALSSTYQIFFIDSEFLTLVGHLAKPLLSLFSDRFVFIVYDYNNSSKIGGVGEESLIVESHSELICLSSIKWFFNNREKFVDVFDYNNLDNISCKSNNIYNTASDTESLVDEFF